MGYVPRFTTRTVKPGEDAAKIVAGLDAGSHVRFEPGIHALGVTQHKACIFVDKPLKIEIAAGATLRVEDGEGGFEQTTPSWNTGASSGVEIWSGVYTARPALDDLEARPVTTPVAKGINKKVRINATGTPDTFQVGTSTDQTGAAPTPSGSSIAIAGDWQDIGDNIEIRFGATTGHSVNDEWYLGTGGEAVYQIRVGSGDETTAIDGVEIFGLGTLDGNKDNQVVPNYLATDISAGILLCGKVENTLINGVRLRNEERPIMAYGQHTGTFAAYGSTRGGVSLNVRNVIIDGIEAKDCQGALLFGHPSHRGRQNGIVVRNSRIISEVGPCIEPNFRCRGFEIINCELTPNTSGNGTNAAVHTWRGGDDGQIIDCVLVDTDAAMLSTTTPANWPDSDNVTETNSSSRKSMLWTPHEEHPYTTFIKTLNPIAHFGMEDDSTWAEDSTDQGNESAGGTHDGIEVEQFPLVQTGLSVGYQKDSSDYTRIDGLFPGNDPSFIEFWGWLKLDFTQAGAQVVFGHRDGNNPLIQLTFNDSTNVVLQWRDSAGGSVQSIGATIGDINNRSVFCCFRWSDGDQKIWFNDVEVASGTASTSANTYVSALTTLGNTWTSSYATPIQGWLDEITIFDTAQSAANRTAAYNLGIGA